MTLSERLYWRDVAMPEPPLEPPADPPDDDETWSRGLDYWCGGENDEID